MRVSRKREMAMKQDDYGARKTGAEKSAKSRLNQFV